MHLKRLEKFGKLNPKKYKKGKISVEINKTENQCTIDRTKS